MKHNKRTIDSAFAVKATRVVIAGALAVTTLAGALAIDSQKASAAPAPVAFKAEAEGSLGYFKALALKGNSAFDLLPGMSDMPSSLVDVTFGGAKSTIDASASPAATANASTISGNLLGVVDLDTFSITSDSNSNDNNGEIVKEDLLDVDAGRLLNFGLLNTVAESNWNGADVCSSEKSLSKASTQVAGVTIGEDMPFIGTLFNMDVLGIDTETKLVPADGENDSRAIQASATARPLRVDLTRYLSVEIANPSVVAQASGLPGGASVDFSGIGLTLIVNGTEYPVLPETTDVLDIQTPENDFVDISFSLGDTNEEVAADGTSAKGDISLLKLKIGLKSIMGATPELDIIDTALFPLSASAEMPAGGLQCAEATENDAAGETLAETGDNVALYQTLAIAMLGAGAALTIGTVIRKKLAGNKF